MRAAGLRAIDTIVDSTAVLIKRQRSRHSPMIDLVASRIKGVITAKRYVMCQYNVERRCLPAATDITPGKRAATITALNAPGWVAVSSMVERNRIAVVMDNLAAIGAQDILVFEIQNTRERV